MSLLPTQNISLLPWYDPEGVSAPVVVAKGADQIAIKIREVAVAHQVPIMQSPPLTRAVFYSTEIDEVIPAKLYLAVAQVLAYIYQLRQRPSYRSSPGPIRNSELNRQIEIPEELQFDAAVISCVNRQNCLKTINSATCVKTWFGSCNTSLIQA